MRATRLPAALVLALALALVGGQSVAAASAPRLRGAPDCPIFPLTNVWNKRVDALPVHPQTSALVASIGLDRYLHPDFSSFEGGGYGIPINVVGSGASKRYFTFEYASESDRGPYPIPRRPKIEGGSDRHMLVVNRDTCYLYELYAVRKIDGRWHAGSGAIWNMRRNCSGTAGVSCCGSSVR